MSVAVEQGKSTTMQALKPALAPEASLPNLVVGFTSLQAFELTQRVANMFAKSTIVPETFQNNLANCCIALEMAQRLGASPLMVMQNLDVIYGRPAWRAKFLIASFNQCGRFDEIQYTFTGTKGKDSWGCIASSVSKRTKKSIEGPEITIALAKEEGWYDRKGSKWKTIPQLMLMYRAGAWLVNTYAPEISMGLSTDDEIRDVYDASGDGNGHFAVDLESLRVPAGASVEGEIVPQYDTAAALKALREAGDLKGLNEAWDDIIKDYDATKRNLPVEVEATYKERKEGFEQNEKL